MIIQIDHIAFAAPDYERTSQILKNLGYQNKFDAKNIDNPKIKKLLMKKFPRKHNLSLFVKKGSINIECLNHFNSGGTGYILPIFENSINIGNSSVLELAKIIKKPIPVCTTKQNNNIIDMSFNKFTINTENIDESVSFWANFGFRRKGLYNGSVVLEFASLFDNCAYKILLRKRTNNERHFLDDIGFNCIAFVSSSCKKELFFFKKKGIMVTEIENLIINKKRINLFFVKGPGGELVEVVDFENKN
jgi:hypothetical protein